MNNQNTPSIYVACLAAYTSGYLHGRWIDVTDESSLRDEIQDMLNESPIKDAEEWAIHDYEGFGGYQVHEWEDIEILCELAEMIQEHGEWFVDLVQHLGGKEYALDAMKNYYYGEHKSDFDFASDLFDELYANAIPDSVRFYIDYDKFCQDLFINDYFFIATDHGVHVFSNH